MRWRAPSENISFKTIFCDVARALNHFTLWSTVIRTFSFSALVISISIFTSCKFALSFVTLIFLAFIIEVENINEALFPQSFITSIL